MADGYYDHNSNNPTLNYNQLQNFDLHSGVPRLSLIKGTVDKSDKILGIHLDVGAGETMRLIHAGDPAAYDHQALRYVEQMYVILKPNHLHGTEIDFGQFVTSAGAEVHPVPVVLVGDPLLPLRTQDQHSDYEGTYAWLSGNQRVEHGVG